MNNSFLFKLSAAICTYFLMVGSVYATVVNDPELEKNYEKIQQTQDQIYNFMVDKLYPEIEAEKNAKENSKLITEHNLSGNSGLGMSLDNAEQQSFRDWTPSALDLEQMVSQGLQTNSLTDRIKYYNKKFYQPVVDETNGNSAHDNFVYVNSSVVSSNISLGMADVAFNRSQVLQKQLTHLYALLDQQNTLKQSADLRSAVALKIIEIESELLRLQSQQLKQRAISQQKNNLKRLQEIRFIQDVD